MPLPPKCPSPGGPVALDAPVRGTGFTPGRSSLGAWAVLQSAPDAPIRGVILSYSLRCLGCSSPWHRVRPRTIQSGGYGRAPFRPGCSNPGRHIILLSLVSLAFACVAPWFFFCACPSSLLFPRSFPLRFAFPPALSSPPPPFLSSLPSAPVTLCPFSPFPWLPFPPFVVALLGHALKLLVSTRACCYVLGQAHTYISFFPAFSLFLCIAFFFVAVSSLVPLFPSPFPCCPLCCFGALLATSPLRPPVAPCPLPPFARTSYLFGAHTQAPPPMHALCHLLCLAPLPSAYMLFTYFLVGPLFTCTWLGVFMPSTHDARHLLCCTPCTWRRPRVGV